MTEQQQSTVLLKPIALRVILFIALMWLVKAVELFSAVDVSSLGVYPRGLTGLLGIIFAPLIHSGFEHLFSNTLAIFILLTALFYQYPRSAKYVFAIIYIGSGAGVWLFARESFHIGASGLTHGLMFFLFLIGVLRRDKPAMALAMMVFFLYGSMVWSILPTEERISFESHLFGAVTGIISAILFRNYDPKPIEKKYSWEQEDFDEQDYLQSNDELDEK
ncbi:hypothetical protein A9Q78_04955 [Methylophaga sp. 41_12_T18]|nr:hypothetical protein A9Q78_04955 [Methylophaga sp. 41_12_T18]